MTKKNVKTKTEAASKKTITADNFKLSDYNSKSHAIRTLSAMGYERGAIAKIINIRYQHVRNVLITPLVRDVKKEAK